MTKRCIWYNINHEYISYLFCVREKKFYQKLITRKRSSVKEIDMRPNILGFDQMVEFK